MKIGYEIDKVKLYNFIQKNDLSYGELSSMLGKSTAYVSQVMNGKTNVSSEVLEKLAALMEVDEDEILAKPNSPYENVNPGKRKRSVDIEKEEPRPTFEQRMEDMIMTDEERRRKFFSSQAFIDEMQKRIGNMKAEKEEEKHPLPEIEHDEIEAINPDDRIKEKIELLTNFLSKSIVNGRKYIGTMDLVAILLN